MAQRKAKLLDFLLDQSWERRQEHSQVLTGARRKAKLPDFLARSWELHLVLLLEWRQEH